MGEDNFDLELNKLRNLQQYKNAPEETLRKVAFNNVIEDKIAIGELFQNSGEKANAKRLIKKYLHDFTPETVSDINTLRSIVYLEILNLRLQDYLNVSQEKKEIDLKVVEAIHKNQTQLLVLKDSLGITKLKQADSAQTVSQKISIMRKQFEIWEENNQASRNCTCPYCGQMFLLHIRMEHWEAQRHPYFKDRILYNKPLIELYLANKITKEKLAEILECAPDYIEWVLQKVHKSVEHLKDA